MAADYYSRVYAGQEYLTPGDPEMVALIGEAIRAGGATLVLEVASGKGEAACALAGETGCRVVAVDQYPPFLLHASGKIGRRGLAGRVLLLRGDGTRLPLAHASFDGAYCNGAPSIVGWGPCLRELSRVVRSGGFVIVSDVVWRQQPAGVLGPEWGWLAAATERPSAGEYRGAIEAYGLEVTRTVRFGRETWEEYFRPMRATAAAERARGDAAFAAWRRFSTTRRSFP
jgi:ubiquinone/menaquinone biosynthesis C-methylase UbiE